MMEEQALKVGDTVRIKESARHPYAVSQTQLGDMVVVKIEDPPFKDPPSGAERTIILERADGELYTAVYAGAAYDYKQEVYYESDLELIEGRRF